MKGTTVQILDSSDIRDAVHWFYCNALRLPPNKVRVWWVTMSEKNMTTMVVNCFHGYHYPADPGTTDQMLIPEMYITPIILMPFTFYLNDDTQVRAMAGQCPDCGNVIAYIGPDTDERNS